MEEGKSSKSSNKQLPYLTQLFYFYFWVPTNNQSHILFTKTTVSIMKNKLHTLHKSNIQNAQ